MKCVYIIREKLKKFTTSKNKCATVYVGETTDFSKRKQKYVCSRNGNELLNKLYLRMFRKRREDEVNYSYIENNIDFKILKNKKFEDDGYRKEFEGYLINKLNPLLNTAKKDAVFTRSYCDFKKKEQDLDYMDYLVECRELFDDWYNKRTKLNWESPDIYSIKEDDFVPRDSYLGREAVNHNRDRSYRTWYFRNEIYSKFDSWRTNYDKWKSNLKFIV